MKYIRACPPSVVVCFLLALNTNNLNFEVGEPLPLCDRVKMGTALGIAEFAGLETAGMECDRQHCRGRNCRTGQ